MGKSNPKDLPHNPQPDHPVEEEIDPILSGPGEADSQIVSEEHSQDIEQLTNALQRVQADFVNFKRRSEDDKQEQLIQYDQDVLDKIHKIIHKIHTYPMHFEVQMLDHIIHLLNKFQVHRSRLDLLLV